MPVASGAEHVRVDPFSVVADEDAEAVRLAFDADLDARRSRVPEGVDQEKLRGLPATFQKLDSPEVAKASKKIATHAKDVCKLSFVG